MGYYTHGHVRCRLRCDDDVRAALAAIQERRALPPRRANERVVAMHRAFSRVTLLSFWHRATIICASFEARHDECDTLMEAIRPLVVEPDLAHGVWGYTSYEDGLSPLVLYSTQRLTMQHPEPDIIVNT